MPAETTGTGRLTRSPGRRLHTMRPATRQRALFPTLSGAAVAGVLLWLAGACRALRQSAATGSHTGSCGSRGLAPRRSDHAPRATGAAAAVPARRFLPVLVVAGAGCSSGLQPTASRGTGRSHARSPGRATSGVGTWSSTSACWVGVLAFGIGYALGLTLEPPRQSRTGRRTGGARSRCGRRAGDRRAARGRAE